MPRDRMPGVISVPEGYTLIRTDTLLAILREVGMVARFAVALTQQHERALVDGLLPTLTDGIGAFMRAHAKRSEAPHA